jgi:Cu2+-exporting ATPase
MPALPAVSYLRDPASGELRATPVAGLVVGDVIVVPMGDIIPVDGLIISGDSEVQEAVLTGESRPLLRGRGDRVVAGSTNLSQVLEVRVEAVATHTILSRILRRMDEAMGARTRMSRLSDLAAQWFVSALLVVALGTALGWWWMDPTRVLEITVAVLVVSCPCALALAIPATLAATGRRLALKGVLVLQGQAIEDLAAAETIVFDKTGTLTTGQPALEVAGWSGEPLRDGFLARLVMGLEAQQAHPYAEALVRACADKVGSSLHPHLLEVRHVPGRGVEGRVGAERWRLGTPAFVAELAPHQKPPSSPFGSDMGVSVLGDSSGCHLWFGFKDDLKPDALCLIQALKALGKRIVILSGDRPEVVQSIAERLGGIEAHGGCTPEDKERRVLQWSQRGPVVMVGDGLNDALGFARAGVSIVLGHAARALTRGADLMIPSGKLGVLGEALKASLDARSRIRQNLVWATAYNLFAIPLAMLGLLNPWLAALGMSVSSLVVVINGVRPWKS